MYIMGRLLRQKKRRSTLTVLGISIGVYSVLIIAIIGMSGKEMLNRELGKLGFNCITISASDKKLNQLTVSDIRFLEEIPEVAVAAPLVVNMGQVSTRGFVGDAVICGIDRSTSQIVQIQLLYGRLFTSGELAGESPVCIVDETLAKAFYKRSNIVGKEIILHLDGRQERFKVVGVSGNSSSMLTNLVGDYVPSFVYLPYTTQMAYTGRSAIDQLFLQLDSTQDYESLGEQLSTQLSRRAGYLNLYRHSNLATQKDRLNSIFQIVTLVLMAIGSISFIVSGLSIMTIMLSSIKERTREIGIKKAIGAGKLDIMLEFLLDALGLSVTGCAGGFGAAIATIALLAWVFRLPLVLPFTVMLGIFLFSVAIGVIFGVYPALIAGKMHPVEALRSDR